MNTYRYLYLLLATTVFFISCEDNENVAGAIYKGPIEEVQNVEVLYSEEGELKVQMRTPKQLRYQNDNKVFPDTVNINFYNPEGAIITRLRADSGHYNKGEDVFVVIGNVRVMMSETNQLLRTSELKWSPRTQKVFTDRPLTVKNHITGEITKAVGMDADQDFSHIKFRKGTGIYRFEGAP
ncbi:LPS export ABC transporter periplasmic protein LptC [Dyadobacter tibetensis]|uniref:LPS export ABC transporter periplasmic protein LptC n=1 Tax=Dyadobacter tibetensis TaxID=1211851 RepID=UPI00047268A9|nr:LPS export ABC transporter periplasmic protein LptC [Dyadobacter tibetensis]